MIFDPMYFVFVGPFLLLALLAQGWVRSSVGKWSKVATSRGLTGHDVAREVLRAGGVEGVQIEQVRGFLSDHYDPRTRVLRLSPQNYQGRSVAAAAIAAHEAGHAIQHARAYAPLKLRSMAVPVASLGSNLMLPLFLAGMFLRMPALLMVGMIGFGCVVLFQLITLPVEFDASRRAKLVLAESGLVTSEQEARGVSAVLTAAAMTYVAAAAQSIATLVYYLWRSGFLGGRSN